jgi:DNA polymerase III epsilon subunit-like protein
MPVLYPFVNDWPRVGRMSVSLIVDCETTGLPGRGVPVYVVQLAWALDDEAGVTRMSGNFMVQPSGWTIPDEVVRIHGITTETATKYGAPERYVYGMFQAAVGIADVIVGHNVAFDVGVLTENLIRLGMHDWVSPRPTYCTMHRAAPVMGQVSARTGRPKMPRMSEAYTWATGLALDNAHDAQVDMLAARAVYYRLRALGM